MKAKQWNTLAWSTLVIVALGVGMSIWRDHDSGMKPKSAFDKLESQLNEVTKVSIRGAGGASVTLERADQGWVVAEKARYPADTGTLRKELLQLAQLQLLEAKTKKPENYAQLGVQGIDKAGSETVEVQVVGNNNAVLAQLLIGKSATGGGYVRLNQDAQSWLASAHLNFSVKATDWLDKEVINVEASRVRKVNGQGANSHFVVEKIDSGDSPVLKDVVKGRAVKEGEVRRLMGALANLRFDDVVPAGQAPAAKAEIKTRFETGEGMAVDVTAYKADDKVYATLEASAIPVPQVPKTAATTSATKDAPVVAPAAPLVNVQAEVETLNRRYKGWVYIIPAYQGEVFLFGKESMLEPLIKLKGKK